MNADIIRLLCPHLDLQSLFSLTAAYPMWSSLIHKHLEKKKLTVELQLEFGQYSGPEICNVKCQGELCVSCPRSIWNHIPFHVMDVSRVDIIMNEWSTLAEDVYALLSKVTTTCLNITFRRRDVVRKLLETIHFKPWAAVKLQEQSKGVDREPILRKSQLASFQTVEYSGDMRMISKDLLEALDHDYVIAFAYGKRGSQCKPWFDELVEVLPEHLKGKSSLVRCIAREPHSHFEIERILDKHAAPRYSAPRSIVANYAPFSWEFGCSGDGVSVTVENCC